MTRKQLQEIIVTDSAVATFIAVNFLTERSPFIKKFVDVDKNNLRDFTFHELQQKYLIFSGVNVPVKVEVRPIQEKPDELIITNEKSELFKPHINSPRISRRPIIDKELDDFLDKNCPFN